MDLILFFLFAAGAVTYLVFLAYGALELRARSWAWTVSAGGAVGAGVFAGLLGDWISVLLWSALAAVDVYAVVKVWRAEALLRKAGDGDS